MPKKPETARHKAMMVSQRLSVAALDPTRVTPAAMLKLMQDTQEVILGLLRINARVAELVALEDFPEPTDPS